MRRFAMPALLLAGVLALPIRPAHADICVGVAVFVMGQQYFDMQPQCVPSAGVPFCRITNLVIDGTGTGVIVSVCVPVSVNRSR